MLFTGIGALIVVTIASYILRQKHRWKGKEKTTATSLKEYLHLERKKKRGKHGPYYVATTFIGVKSKGHTEFMITKESGKDRFLKKLGISSEFHTKDSDFDNSFYITCDDSQVNNSLAMRPEAREIIKELFTNYPIECLIHSKGKLWVEYNLEAPITDIETIVDKLNEILPLFQKMQVGFVSKLVDKNLSLIHI